MSEMITLPGPVEMLERLEQVCNISHLREHFYPLLLKHAGQRKVAQGIVMMLFLAIDEYAEKLTPPIADLMYMLAPEFIGALVSDTEVAQEAKTLLAEALRRTRETRQ